MESFTIFSEQVLGHLWTVSWQVSVLIGIIWLVDVFIPRASSHFRYWLWSLVLLRLLVPVGTIMNEIETVFPKQSDILFKTTENITNLPVKAMEALPFQSAFAVKIPDSIVNTPAAFIVGMYIIGLVCFAVIIITTIYRVNRLLYVCEPVERPEVIASFRKHKDGIGLSRNVGLLRMDTHHTKMPAYFGLFRPQIVFSRTIIDDWPAGEYEPVLLHELFHVKRWDLLVNWLQVIIQALYFFHPLVWLVNRRIRTLREQVCDDQVLSYMKGDRARYAQSMLRIMEEKSSAFCPDFAVVGFSESTNTFRERIERIMKTNYSPVKGLTVPSILILFVIAVMSIVMACENSEQEMPTQSTALKSAPQPIENKKFALTVLGGGNYDIGGVQSNKSTLEEVYRKQLIQYDYQPHYIRVKGDKIHSHDEYQQDIIYLNKITQQVNEDTRDESRAAAKARTERHRKFKQQVKTKKTILTEAGILSEANSILAHIIQFENTHYATSKSYVDFDFGEDCPVIGFAQPGNAHFTYAFKDGKAIAKERIDVNEDGDTDDGLTLSLIRENGAAVSLEAGTLPGSNLVWSVGDKEQIMKRLGLKLN